MEVFFASQYDGSNETLSTGGYTHPSLTSGLTSSTPSVLYFRGVATSEVYLEALRNVRYENRKGRPTTGSRIIAVSMYDGQTSNPLAESYVNLTVSITNVAPLLSLSGNTAAFVSRFYPQQGPVPAAAPDEAFVIDTDSVGIMNATLRLQNALNGAAERLEVTYRSMEQVSLPVVVEATNLSYPFGRLWNGTERRTIQHSVLINDSRLVGDVDVVVDIRHSWIGDLKIELEHDGRRELLVLSPGGQTCARDNLFSSTFDSDSSANVSLSKTLQSPGLCQFQTQGLFAPDGDLENFKGDNIGGEWTLHITDLELAADTGRLVSWSLVIQPQEPHLIVASPPVVPPLMVGVDRSIEERHYKQVDADGRITGVAVHVHLAVPFGADHLTLPTLKLIHPDGTQLLLSDGNFPLCGYGNYTYLVFDDKANTTSEYRDYACVRSVEMSGSGSGFATDETPTTSTTSTTGTTGTTPTSATTQPPTLSLESNDSSMSASGSGSGANETIMMDSLNVLPTAEETEEMEEMVEQRIMELILPSSLFSYLPNIADAIDMNISIPEKLSLVDLIPPYSRLSSLNGKSPNGRWTLVMSRGYRFRSSLVGWSLRIAREPNIDHSYSTNEATLYLSGEDSALNYQTVLRSVVYNNMLPRPDFSKIRYIDAVVFDGQAFSRTDIPQARTYLTVHHIAIDLDPLNISNAVTPNFNLTFQEHSTPLAILDPANVILSDGAFNRAEYALTITLYNYSNTGEEGVRVINSSSDILVLETVESDSAAQRLVLTITSMDPLPIERFREVLRTAEYYNSAEEVVGDSRVVEFIVSDQTNNSRFTSELASTFITIQHTNDRSIIVLNSYRQHTPSIPNVVSYRERQIVDLANSSAVSISDNDDSYLQSLIVHITNALDGINETLSVSSLGSTMINYTYFESNNSLLLYGNDTLENYAFVVGGVQYENLLHSPGKPNPTTRIITFVGFDGEHYGPAAITMLSFTAINDRPFGYLDGIPNEGLNTSATFIEEEGAVVIINSTAMIFDVDDDTLTYLTVRITNALDGENEILAVMNISKMTASSENTLTIMQYHPNVNFNPVTSTLTITGLSSVYLYQEVLKTLTYNNLADEPDPTTRLVEIVMSDGLLTSDPLYSIVEIVLINDSPFFNSTAPDLIPVISEDIPNSDNNGTKMSDFAYLILDDDVGSSPGVAIVAANYTNGRWEYSVNNSSWIPLPTNLSLDYALVLTAVDRNRIRFLPNQDYNGNTTITIAAWDGTDGMSSGSYLSARDTSAIDPFSSELKVITLIVQPVNDAPVLPETPINMTTILEDDYNSTGDTVLSLLQLASDVDIPKQQSQLGIVITEAQDENGIWQFSTDAGQNWEDFDEVSEESVILLYSIPENDNRVRFVPYKDFNGQVTLRYNAWDLSAVVNDTIVSNVTVDAESASGLGLSSGSGSGLTVSSMTPPVVITSVTMLYATLPTGSTDVDITDLTAGSLSINSNTAVLTIEPVNDSPVVTEGMHLMDIPEDFPVVMNHGTQVKQIIEVNRYYVDVDANPQTGLAVVEVDNRHGRWQYTCENPPSNWQDFIGDMYYGTVAPALPIPEKATLLLSSCWIRFLPQPHFTTELDTRNIPRPASDTPYLVVYGWDNTGLTRGRSGTYGNDATYGNVSIINEYSARAVRVTATVPSDNDVSVVLLTNETVADYSTTFLEDLPSIRAVGDNPVIIDHDHNRLINMTITINGGSFSESPFSHLAVLDQESSASGSGDSVPLLYALVGSGSGSPEASEVRLPLAAIQNYVRGKENSTELELYCAGLHTNVTRKEELFVDITNTDLRAEVVSWCPFEILISADPEYGFDADKAQFEKVLRSVRYNNSIQEPSPEQRNVTFVVSDGVSTSIPATAFITIQLINDAPILDLNDYIPDINNFVAYTEGNPPLVLVNSSGLRLVDFDNTYLQYARIELHEAPDTINETLSANTTGTNINANYANFTLHLTGNDTVQAYAQVLATVTYHNNYAYPGNPDDRERQIVFFVSDGMKESSPAVTRLSFTSVNNRPYIDVNGDTFGINGTFTFREEEGPVPVTDPRTTIHDIDNVTLAYVTVQILNPLDGVNESLSVDTVTLQEVLERNMNDLNKVVEFTYLIPNITYNTTSALLNITGLDTTTEYRIVIMTLVYNNLADEPDMTPRIIEFIASDGLLLSEPAYSIMNMVELNDSPRLNPDIPIMSPLILEDDVNTPGWTVQSIAYHVIEDDDPGHTRGIAVVEVESDKGQWQYRTNPSLPWETISNDSSLTYALLLTASDSNFIRFVPNKDAIGNATLTFVAWDGSDGFDDGIIRVAISRNVTDPFSVETREFTVVIVPVNDPPVINSSLTIVLPPILEDDVRDRPSQGQDVSVFLPALVEDIDMTDQFGVAIVDVDNSNGQWQYTVNNGSLWQNITNPLPSSALVLQGQQNGRDRIRFAPALNYNGPTSLTFKLWDLNITYPSGTRVNTLGSHTFSIGTAMASQEVEPVNDSPVILPGMTLTPIFEEITTSNDHGTPVREILRDHYEDVDVGFLTGLAVVCTDIRFGRWQYTCDPLGSDTTWLAFIGGYQFGQIAPRLPNEQRATLLLEHCRIRFIPNINFNTELDLAGNPRPASDAPYICVRGWDATEYANMNYSVDTTSNPDNHLNSFSRDILNATIIVRSENDRPVLLLGGATADYTTTYTEPITPHRTIIPVPLVNATFSLIDVDNENLTFAVVSFQRHDGDQETLLYDLNGTSLNSSLQIDANTDTYRLVFTPSNGEASPISDYRTALRSLRYQNSAEEPDPRTRTISIFVQDQGNSLSNLPTTEMQIQLVNDPPELDLNRELIDTYNFVNYTEGEGPVSIVASNFSLVDYDNSSFVSVEVLITSAPDTEQEVLSADSSLSSNITVSFSDMRLVLTGPATTEEFMAVLATVTYNNSFSHPGNPSDATRVIQFIVNDGLNDSIPANTSIFFTAVNNKPIFDVNGNASGFNYETTFYEEQGPVRVVAMDTLIMDIDNLTLAFIQVTIENLLDGPHERLWVNNVTELKGSPSDPHYSVWNFRPSQYYNVSTGTLIVSGLENVHEYQQVLRTLMYNNTADEPSNQTRIIQFAVSDGISTASGVQTTLHIMNINDSPYFNQSASLYEFTTYEDVPLEQNAGWSLEDLAGSLILDDDANSIPGIAITQISTANGRWEYTTDYDTTPPPPPTNVPTTSAPTMSGNLNDLVSDMSSGSGSGLDSLQPVSSGDVGSGITPTGSGDMTPIGSGDMTPIGSGDMTPITPTSPPFYFRATWYPIPNNTALTYATALRLNGSSTRIRFVSNKDFNGEITVSFVLWDATDGLADGAIANATSVSRIDAYSSQFVTLRGIITPVNDAPLLSNITVNLTQIKEDNRNSDGDDITRLVAGVSDIDANDTSFGVAIVGVNDSNGMWQFSTDSGLSWTSLVSISYSNALVLSSQPVGQNKLRFWPNQDYNGYSDVVFVAWDLTSGPADGSFVNVAATDRVTGPFSRTNSKAQIFVEPVNDSPVLSSGLSLTAITEGLPIMNNNGTLVATILRNGYIDVDANAEEGLAVVSVDERFGQWQYRCFSIHSQWQDFIGDFIYGVIIPALPLIEKATLLSATDCSIRFQPTSIYFNTINYINGTVRPGSDTPYIMARGWDNTGLTQGLSGRYGVDSTINNESIINEFGREVQRIEISVISINNLPVLRIASAGDGRELDVLFTEDDPYVRIVEPAAIRLTDIDNTTMQSVKIEVMNPMDEGTEMIDLVLLPNTSNVVINRTSNVATVTVGNQTESLQLIYEIFNTTDSIQTSSLTFTALSGAAEVSIEAYEALLPHLVYKNSHSEPENTTRLIHHYINDGSQLNLPVTTMVTYRLLAENHPILITYLYQFDFTEGGPSPVPLVAPNTTLTDEDHNEFFLMASFVITINPVPPSEDERVAVDLSVVPSDVTVTQSYDESVGELRVQGNVPVAVYQAIVRTAIYINIDEEPEPGVREIKLQVTDLHGLSSNTETVFVNVSVINDQVPVLTTSSEPFEYTEHRVNTSPMPVVIGENATITDDDGGDLPIFNITVTLTNPMNGNFEILNATSSEQIEVMYSNFTLLLLGPASVDEFQAVLSTLSYVNTAEEPIAGDREFVLVAADEDFLSNVTTITVTVEVINDAPVIDLNGPTESDIDFMLEYVEGSGAVSIVSLSDLEVYDYDHNDLVQAMVVIQDPYDAPNELLSVDETLFPNISVSYNATSGSLLLEGSADVLDYQTLLRTAMYENTIADPGKPSTIMRIIAFTVFDGERYNSPVAETFLTFASVNDPPMLDLNGDEPGRNYSVEFTEESDPVILTNDNFTLVDIDSDMLTEARVVVTNCLDGQHEILSSFVSSSSAVLMPLSESYVRSSCTLIIRGEAPVETYRDVLGSVTYQNTADEPFYTPRLIRVTVKDAELYSIARYTTVDIIAVNDPPRLRVSSGTFSFGDNITLVPGTPTTAPSPTAGPDQLLSGMGSGASGSGEGLMPFSGDEPTTTAPTTTNPVTTEPATATTMAPINTNITQAEHLVTYIENAPAVNIVQPSFVRIEDDDDTISSRVQVTIQDVMDSGHEAVFFRESDLNSLPDLKVALAPYVSASCPPEGARFSHIDLARSLLLQQMEVAIRSLHYCNSDEHPTPGNRTVTFRIQDPQGAWSNLQTTVILVVAVNDNPIYQPVDSFQTAYEIDEDTNITIGVLANFFDHEEVLNGSSIRIVDAPANATTTVDQQTGNITFSPMRDAYGFFTVFYRACDSHNHCSLLQNITITVRPINDPPYPADDLNLVIDEDQLAMVDITQFFGDVEDDLIPGLQYPRVTKLFPGATEIIIRENGTMLDIRPFQHIHGNESVAAVVCDSNMVCINITIMLVIRSINDLPFFLVTSPVNTPEDTVLNISITLADVESRLTEPIAFGVISVSNGTGVSSNISEAVLSIVPPTETGDLFDYRNGLKQDVYVLYTPDKNFYGEDMIVLFANDTEGGYSEHNISITVHPINDAPEFGIIVVDVVEDIARILTLPDDLVATDPEDILHAGSFSIVDLPQNGNLTYSFNQTYYQSTGMFPRTGTLIYTPDLNFNGTDFFSIRACDNHTVVACTNQTITVLVEPKNDVPQVPLFNVTGNEDTLLRFNLQARTYDAEEVNSPADAIRLLDPLPSHGTVSYDNTTGFVEYSPFLNFFGEDNLFFEACDSRGACNSSGQVLIIIQNVNDPPQAMDFTFSMREDDFDLIDIFQNSHDNESSDADLKISIVNTTTQELFQEFTTAMGGSLRVYQIHGVVTYEPPQNYVGPDSFTYSVCDPCDPRRDVELGRVDPDPECTKQSSKITCDEAIVSIIVVNQNDVPILRDISTTTKQGETVILSPFENSQVSDPASSQTYLYRNISAAVFDYDDLQSYQAQNRGLDLNLYNLTQTTNIDELSLMIRPPVSNGRAEINPANRRQLIFTPNQQFSGYAEFNYQICDLAIGSESPRCSEATARVFVTKPGPSISILEAIPYVENQLHTDSKVSRGDQIRIQFSEDTNMPPHGVTMRQITADDIDQLLEFSSGFIPPTLVPNRYTGQWETPRNLVITVNDEGYPQPESKIGNWTMAVRPNAAQCGGFDSQGQILVSVNRFCLLSADGNSVHSTATSPLLTGNWGLRLPLLSSILVRNIAVEDNTQENNRDELIFPKTQFSLIFREPFSYQQLMLYCEQPAENILDLSLIGTGVQMNVVGCANLLRNGEDANTVYERQIRDTASYFSSIQSSSRSKRATSLTELPVGSEVVLQIQSYSSLHVNPRVNQASFISRISSGLNNRTIASVINQLLGVNISILESYTLNLPISARPIVSQYSELDDNLTPEVTSVVAHDPNCRHNEYGVGDIITIHFDRVTDQPPATTKAQLDKIFVFNPSLGADYTGEWLPLTEVSPPRSRLQITIVTLGSQMPSETNFSLSFTNNYLTSGVEYTGNSSELPSDRPHCIGVNVCGGTSESPSIGVCSNNQLSCRAYKTVMTLDGNFDGGLACSQLTSLDWVWVLIAVVLLIIITGVFIFLYFAYRRYKREKERKQALIVVQRWKNHSYSPGKQEGKEDMPKPWSKPTDRDAMRDVPDPFAQPKDGKDPLKNLPAVARPPTAAPAEGLPSITAVSEMFKPRAGARIQPSLPLSSTLPGIGTAGSSIGPSSLPSLTPLVSLHYKFNNDTLYDIISLSFRVYLN